MYFSILNRLIFTFLLAFVFSSCGMTQILGLSREEAVQRLEKGDIGFILEAEIPDRIPRALSHLRPLARISPNAAFFAGLLTEAEEVDNAAADIPGRSSLLFALALENSPPVVRRESAKKLMLPVLENDQVFAREVLKLAGNRTADQALTSLGNACLFRLGRHAEIIRSLRNTAEKNTWDNAFYILSLWKNTDSRNTRAMENIHKEALDFFLTEAVDSAWHWALNEFTAAGADFFGPAELAALSVRAETARTAFGRGVFFMGLSLASDGTSLFLQYPQLLTDAGRSIQFTNGFINEGIELLTLWEEDITAGRLETDPAMRYLLPYFLGRIYRQAGQTGNSTRAFERALRYAPEPLQADACIWYILMNAFTESPEFAVLQLKEYIPRMNSIPYFRDILDRASQYLVSRRNWGAVEEIFDLLRPGENGSSGEASGISAAAQYPWILGRAVEEGYYSARENNYKNYYQAIYDEENASLYYRILSAWKLGLDIMPGEHAPAASNQADQRNISPEAEFLLGFFNFNAGSLAMPYIREYQNSLEAYELRLIASALADAGITNESLNLVSSYYGREVSRMTREDFELFYPRPFEDLITKYTQITNVAPGLFYAIIRTESYFMPEAVSRAGAVGLSQLIPATALDMAARIARRTGPDYRSEQGIDLKDPEINVHIGSFYINYLLETLDSPMLAILAYNGGMGRVRRWRASEPRLPEDLFLETIEFEETREYGRRILLAAAVYGYLYYGMNTSEVVADIYR